LSCTFLKLHSDIAFALSALLAVGYQALKAATENPVKAIKSE